MADIAKVAGVSIATVSKALNGRGKLRDETRQEIQATARRLGFTPNDLARSLLRGRTFTVGLMTSDSFGRFSIPVTQGIEDSLGAGRIAVFLCDARGDAVREQYYLDALLSRKVDGIIVSGRRADPRPPLAGRRLDIPVVYVFAQSTDPRDVSVIPDDVQGGRLAVEHLIAAGRKRLAHVTGFGRFEQARLRYVGALAAADAAGVELPPERVLAGPWTEAWGYEAACRLLAEPVRVDGVFCGNDQIGRGMADALRDRGVRVPDDVALVGYDNWEVLSAATRPALTSVDMNLEGLGRHAVQLLLRMIDGEQAAGVHRLPCHLVVRESCGVGTRLIQSAGARGSSWAAEDDGSDRNRLRLEVTEKAVEAGG